MSSYTYTSIQRSIYQKGLNRIKEYNKKLEKIFQNQKYKEYKIADSKKLSSYQSKLNQIKNRWNQYSATQEELIEIERKMDNLLIKAKEELLELYEERRKK